jgi:Domain of unknown function (DUF4329)
MVSLDKTKNTVIVLCTFLTFVSSDTTVAGERELLENKIDQFAASHLDTVQEKSFKDGHEYCGLIFYNRAGELKVSKEKKGQIDSCVPDDVSEEFNIIASYHTHGSANLDADTEVPSYDDLDADIEEGINGYIATPGGRLWLNNAKIQKSIMLCGKGCLKADSRFVECMAIFPEKEYTLDSLVSREENDTGEC